MKIDIPMEARCTDFAVSAETCDDDSLIVVKLVSGEEDEEPETDQVFLTASEARALAEALTKLADLADES